MALALTLTVSARAQFRTDADGLLLADPNSWVDGTVSGLITGTNDALTLNFNGAFTEGSNILYTGTFNATRLAVGDRITGSGVPDGAVVTGIDNAGRVTLSAAFTASGTTALTVSSLGAADGYGTVRYTSIAGSLVVDEENNQFATLTISGTMTDGREATATNLGARVGQNLRGIGGMNVYDYITEIIDEKTFRLATPNTFNADSGNVEFTSLSWRIRMDTASLPGGTGTISGDLVYRNTDPWVASMGFAAGDIPGYIVIAGREGASTAAIVYDTNGKTTWTFGDTGRTLTLDFAGQDAVFNITPRALGDTTGRDLMQIRATGTNLASLTVTGNGYTVMDGNPARNHNYYLDGGPLTVNGGVLQMRSSSGGVHSGAIVRGAGKINLVGKGALLYLDLTAINGSQTAAVNFLEPDATVNLYASQLGWRADGSTIFGQQQTGDVILRGGRSALAFDDNTVNNFTLTLNSLTRENHATLNFAGLATAGAVSVKIAAGNDGNIIGDLVGTGTDSGVTNLKILPWATARGTYNFGDWGQEAIVSNGGGNSFAASDLVTYDSAGGFRVLAANEYAALPTVSGSDDNVRLAADLNVSGTDFTVNSLSGRGAYTQSGYDTLTVASGLVAATTGGLSISGGTLDTGDRALILAGNGSDVTLAARLTNTATGDTPSLIIASLGRTFLDGTGHDFTGTVLVQGALWFRNGTLPAAAAIRVDRSGLLLTDGARNIRTRALAGSGTVKFGNAGSRLVVGGTSDTTLFSNYTAGWISVDDTGILAPGDADGEFQADALMLSANILGVRFYANSILDLDLASDTVSDLLSISLDNTSAPTLMFDDGAIIRLNFLNDYTPAADNDWLLTTGFSAVSGDLNNVLLRNYAGTSLSDEWSLSTVGGNLLLTYTIPEPSTWLLLTLGATLLVTLRRRC
ncbi:MAG: PEP-CTERM sorting domain-containing protein [Verrucomicrobiales bacterium]|jgi:hypothetical protein|nr:PEP-CTERM sorting domain-containing protein [Verrucomicrobiales bacterium]